MVQVYLCKEFFLSHFNNFWKKLYFTFISQFKKVWITWLLADMLDSLVRVSRRDVCFHLRLYPSCKKGLHTSITCMEIIYQLAMVTIPNQ